VNDETVGGHRRLVSVTADKLRELVIAQDPDTQIGSLRDLARQLGVGIVTVQQAARILEHQGLLDVRRGPGGGYYGKRPDEAALERAIAAYIYVHNRAYDEARDMASLLHCELASAAADCPDEQLHAELRGLSARIDGSNTEELRVVFEEELHGLLCRMADKPLIALLTRVTIRLYKADPMPPLYVGPKAIALWKTSRRRLINAILERDAQRTRFEAGRNRDYGLERLIALRSGKKGRRRS
jgi:GntR family transcriptional repressor for pyruvate dehydrogenase complex